ncbi:pol protein [Cucumis melo var. makuwa]|uniref:Pol protein n=1 Tax=Cucumis melo var. makuwa TaxID=1194695 RepID=A0A5A7TRB1_CUCMM|nr:pol protein [Cucumis melo var. makuwa]
MLSVPIGEGTKAEASRFVATLECARVEVRECIYELHHRTAKEPEGLYSDLVRLHGVPVSIVFDRDAHFTSKFWRGLQIGLSTRLDFSTTFHPQTDGVVDLKFVEVRNPSAPSQNPSYGHRHCYHLCPPRLFLSQPPSRMFASTSTTVKSYPFKCRSSSLFHDVKSLCHCTTSVTSLFRPCRPSQVAPSYKLSLSSKPHV